MTTAFIPGVPQQQGSTTAYVRGGRAVVTSANKQLKPWRREAAQAIREAHGGRPPYSGAVNVSIVFHLPRPKSVKRSQPHVRPDLDKYIRACLDALTDSGAIDDDGQVCQIWAVKRYAANASEVGASITVIDQEVPF